MHGWIIRPAQNSDVEACVALAVQAAAGGAEMWREALIRDVENPGHHLVVAAIGEQVVWYGRTRIFEPEQDAPADTRHRVVTTSRAFSSRKTGAAKGWQQL